MNLQPIGTRVLIKPDPAVEETKGGIILADVSIERDPQGVVIAVGPEVTKVKMDDHVMFGKYSGWDLGIEDVLVDEEDIHCIILED